MHMVERMVSFPLYCTLLQQDIQSGPSNFNLTPISVLYLSVLCGNNILLVNDSVVNSLSFCSGSTSIGIEAEPEEETEACEKAVVEKASQKTEIQIIEDHPDSIPVSTPLRFSRFDMLTFCQLR